MGSKAMMTVKVESMNNLNRGTNKTRVKVKRAKKPMSRRTKFTILAIFNLTWYTIVSLVLSYLDHPIPSELTVAWFSAWTVELALLFGIKVKSINEESKLNQLGIFDENDTVEAFGDDEEEQENYEDDEAPTDNGEGVG